MDFLSSRLEPTGFLPPLNMQTDKGTTVHNTRQFTTVATVVPGSESLVSIVYLGQPIVKSHTGEGVSKSICEELCRYQIDPSQLEGGSYDGQYFHLNVPQHLTEQLNLSPQFQCTLDPLHLIGVLENRIRKDIAFAWLVSLTSSCQQIYKKFNWGKNYQALVEMCEKLDMRMRNLKTFSTTRFPNSVRAVFDTLIDDYKAVVKCLEDIKDGEDSGSEARKRADEAKAILRKVLSKSFVLQLSGTSDIYQNFGLIANLCQVVDLLPHERFDNVMAAVNNFDKMVKCIDHSECIKLSEKEADENQNKVSKCLWPRYHSALTSLEAGKFKGIDITKDHESNAYFTKLAKKHNDLSISTSAVDICKTKLLTLAKRLSVDLKSGVFEEPTVKTIEMIRNISDLRMFSLEVKRNGSVKTGHKLGNKFFTLVRKITASMDEIPDNEIKENFIKFLKVLEKHVKPMEEKTIDSKRLIKEFLADEKLFTGVELTLHSIVTSAVKVSVESVVESLVSRYEVHFDAKRQLKEDHALEEMEIAENGPELVHADRLLSLAMDKYWKEKDSADGTWHFCHKTNDIRTYSKDSKVVKKLMNVKPKFPFMT